MTPLEHAKLKASANATAARTLMLFPADQMARALPREVDLRSQYLSGVQAKVAATREDYLQITFPEMDPAMSDLYAAELQEAFDRLAAEFLSRLK